MQVLIHTWHIFSGFHDIPAGNDDEEKQFYFLCPALSKKSSYSTTVLMRMYVYSLIFNHQFKVYFLKQLSTTDKLITPCGFFSKYIFLSKQIWEVMED